jgi:type III secretory pathway component EscR
MIRRTQLVHYWPFLLVVLIPSFLAIALGWRYSSAAGISIAFTVIDIVLLGLFFWIYHSNRRVL